MSTPAGKQGVRLFAAIVIAGSFTVSALMHSLRMSVGGSGSGVLVMAAMWVPALARLAATRIFDREWEPPFPLGRWGRPGWAVLIVPLTAVSAIYIGSYALAWLAGVPIAEPVWHGASVAANWAVNLPVLAIVGAFGGLGEELGWRGYLQPRLDQLDTPAALLRVIVLETAFHIPLILLAGYEAGESRAVSIALFFGLKLGATPVWTWATYRWRSIWIAVCFHAFHNALSQVLVPKSLGVGDPRILGESGVLPVALYLVVAVALFGSSRRSGLSPKHFWSSHRAPS